MNSSRVIPSGAVSATSCWWEQPPSALERIDGENKMPGGTTRTCLTWNDLTWHCLTWLGMTWQLARPAYQTAKRKQHTQHKQRIHPKAEPFLPQTTGVAKIYTKYRTSAQNYNERDISKRVAENIQSKIRDSRRSGLSSSPAHEAECSLPKPFWVICRVIRLTEWFQGPPFPNYPVSERAFTSSHALSY
jgi:hypothetical protein